MKPKTIMLLYKQEKAEFEHFFSIELRIKLAKLANVHSFSLKREGEDSEQDTLCCLIFIEYIANSAAVTGHFFFMLDVWLEFREVEKIIEDQLYCLCFQFEMQQRNFVRNQGLI